ncbi:unnamed protein product, partial [Phaedon cochleariae]
IFSLFLFSGLLAAQVEISTRELLVLPGQNATFLCRVGVPLQYCRIELPGSRTFNLNKQALSSNSEVTYYGEGLDAGQCGFTIQRVEERDNGPIKCTLGIPSEPTESVGTMQLIVAKPPKLPELDLSRGTDSLRVYKVNDQLEASCIVRDGRPVANITWFLDDEQISDAGLKRPTVIDLAKENLQSKIQNLTRVLQPSDNGKYLKCVAIHPAYPNHYAETKRQLDVKFAPLAIYEPIDKFGYQLGRVGLINVTIEANPKPQIEWTIGGQTIREGATDNTGRIEAETVREMGRGRYEANLRLAAVTKQDTETDYTLVAYNDMGTQNYRIKISTSPEPEGFELSIGAIIGVVAVILFVIMVASILIFAKVTGRWCFSGESDRELRHIGESSDTESADVRPKEPKKPHKLTAIFKKNKDKPEPEPEVGETEPAPAQIDLKDDKGLVYAELDLARADLKPVVKNDDEKTEYAEIVYTQN